VKNARGEMIPLAELARASWVTGAPKLDRFNGLPSMKISGNAAPGRSTGEAMKAMEEVAAKLPPGVGFEWSGTSYEERQSGSQAPFLFAVSLVVVFLCLAALYESWSIPFAVMLVVPLGIFGSVLAVELRGLTNDVYFKVGLIAIIGLSAKNAILIIEFARELQEQGMDLVEATLEACRLRIRPIVMTSIAFIFGVLPLAISTGAGANSRHAIGTGVMGGMITATVLAVFFVPVFFLVVRRIFPGHSRHHHQEAGMSKRLLSMVSAMAVAAGCSMTPDYERPAAPVPDAWPALQSATALGDSGRAPTVREWREYFPDPRLQALIATALEHNRDLRIAVARVDEARAQAGLARADRLPSGRCPGPARRLADPGRLSATNRQLNPALRREPRRQRLRAGFLGPREESR
jgi:uncharacterized membrane protein